LKYDGFRPIAYLHDGACELVSRNKHVFESFKSLRLWLAANIQVRDAIIDGEICCLDESGKPCVSRIWKALSPSRRTRPTIQRKRGGSRSRIRTTAKKKAGGDVQLVHGVQRLCPCSELTKEVTWVADSRNGRDLWPKAAKTGVAYQESFVLREPSTTARLTRPSSRKPARKTSLPLQANVL
jgi:hypothetical protein